MSRSTGNFVVTQDFSTCFLNNKNLVEEQRKLLNNKDKMILDLF